MREEPYEALIQARKMAAAELAGFAEAVKAVRSKSSGLRAVGLKSRRTVARNNGGKVKPARTRNG